MPNRNRRRKATMKAKEAKAVAEAQAKVEATMSKARAEVEEAIMAKERVQAEARVQAAKVRKHEVEIDALASNPRILARMFLELKTALEKTQAQLNRLTHDRKDGPEEVFSDSHYLEIVYKVKRYDHVHVSGHGCCGNYETKEIVTTEHWEVELDFEKLHFDEMGCVEVSYQDDDYRTIRPWDTDGSVYGEDDKTAIRAKIMRKYKE